MATQIEAHGSLEITSISGDWNYATDKPDDWPVLPRIASIQFDPGDADDQLTITDGNDGGPRRVFFNCEDAYDQRIKYFHGSRMVPYIDYSESSFSAGHRVVIELWRDE